MEIWVLASVTAALLQTIRFMLQKQLSTASLSAAGATFARFAYSAPFVVILLAIYLGVSERSIPLVAGMFWPYALVGGFAQILATVCVVILFGFRNFAVGITLKKTEVMQTALIGFVLLGDAVSISGLGAISLGLAAVFLLSAPPEGAINLRTFLTSRAAGLGLLSGLFFGISAVCYRGATLAVDADTALLRAAVTLAVVTSAQFVAMGIWLYAREAGQLNAVWAARRVAIWVGITSMTASLCWFWAFSLKSAAYVFAVGQIELIFSLAASVFFFREKTSVREFAGMGLLVFSILLLVWVV